jgi:hypothetical protein
MNENQQELIDQKFSQIVNKPTIKMKRPPSKFPELRYLWGATLLVSFILIVISSVITTIIEAL